MHFLNSLFPTFWSSDVSILLFYPSAAPVCLQIAVRTRKFERRRIGKSWARHQKEPPPPWQRSTPLSRHCTEAPSCGRESKLSLLPRGAAMPLKLTCRQMRGRQKPGIPWMWNPIFLLRCEVLTYQPKVWSLITWIWISSHWSFQRNQYFPQDEQLSTQWSGRQIFLNSLSSACWKDKLQRGNYRDYY